jgi:hypothetical protein
VFRHRRPVVRRMPAAFQARTRVEIARFVGGLDLIEPSIGSITEWRPGDEPPPSASAEETAMYGVVARLP